MPKNCGRTTGGKGNIGKFIERDPTVCAAGVPSAQPEDTVADSLQHYLLKDEVDSLLSDAIKPTPPPKPLPPLRHPVPQDKRYAGFFSEVQELMNPDGGTKTKFKTLVEDFKDTVYTSYWKKVTGSVPDPVPMVPEGFDLYSTQGMKFPSSGRLYDTVMPKVPLPDNESPFRKPGYQVRRGYCEPAFKPNIIFGRRSKIDKRGILMKTCLTDERVNLGTSLKQPLNVVQTEFFQMTQPRLGLALTPNDNINSAPKGYSFGVLKPPDNLPECLTTCELNPEYAFFKKCLAHLNSLRKFLSKRFESTFFRKLQLDMKYYDKCKSGWLPKHIVYELCGTKSIRFDPNLIEPLLSLWEAYDGINIKYGTLVHSMNFTQVPDNLPKIWDIHGDCISFETTYNDMVKPGQEVDTRLMAGVPSGRYFDMDYPVTPELCCKADRAYLPQESDAKACLSQSIFTTLGVSHRDMYSAREPGIVRKIFEAAGEKFTDESFETIWSNAKKYNSQGIVCLETFRRALEHDESSK